MPISTPSPATQRTQLFNLRKKIAAISEQCSWVTAAVQNYWIDYELLVSTWVPVADFYGGVITKDEIGVKQFFPDEVTFLRYLNNDPGIELTTVRQNRKDVLLVRPRFLDDQLNQ